MNDVVGPKPCRSLRMLLSEKVKRWISVADMKPCLNTVFCRLAQHTNHNTASAHTTDTLSSRPLPHCLPYPFAQQDVLL